jgi:eukaryotic-like serine/threonine-protein kinase
MPSAGGPLASDSGAARNSSGLAPLEGRVVAEPADPMIGKTLAGRFLITERMGAGSMGTVYRASQTAMGRDVAVKILRSDKAVDENAKARFLREARTNSVLTSPHTVTVFDFGESDSQLFLAMELLEGESLGARLARVGRFPPSLAVEITRQALRSLSEAHAKGIVHRDLKPDNLFFARVASGDNPQEIVKVLDFGIAKMLRDEDRAMNAVETQAGTVFGTPRYMSPEQAQGKPLDARSDLYSLGVILYHMITGAPPFTDDDAILVMARHIRTTPESPSRVCPDATIPEELELVLMRILAKSADARPASAEAMAAELVRSVDPFRPGTTNIKTSIVPPPPQLDSLMDLSGIDPETGVSMALRPFAQGMGSFDSDEFSEGARSPSAPPPRIPSNAPPHFPSGPPLADAGLNTQEALALSGLGVASRPSFLRSAALAFAVVFAVVTLLFVTLYATGIIGKAKTAPIPSIPVQPTATDATPKVTASAAKPTSVETPVETATTAKAKPSATTSSGPTIIVRPPVTATAKPSASSPYTKFNP